MVPADGDAQLGLVLGAVCEFVVGGDPIALGLAAGLESAKLAGLEQAEGLIVADQSAVGAGAIEVGAFEVVVEKAGHVVQVEQGQEGRCQVDLAGEAVKETAS